MNVKKRWKRFTMSYMALLCKTMKAPKRECTGWSFQGEGSVGIGIDVYRPQVTELRFVQKTVAEAKILTPILEKYHVQISINFPEEDHCQIRMALHDREQYPTMYYER